MRWWPHRRRDLFALPVGARVAKDRVEYPEALPLAVHYPIQTAGRGPLFFVHVPKTAGMALREYLANQYEAGETCRATGWAELAREDAEGLARYRLVQGHFAPSLAALLHPGIRTLIVLREPVARTVSVLRHIRRDPAFHWLHERAKSMSLHDMTHDPALMAEAANGQVGLLSSTRPARDVLAAIRAAEAAGGRPDPYAREDTPLLERAVRRLEALDFVGTTERLGELLRLLGQEMHYHPALRLPSVNHAPADADDLSAADLEHVRAANDLDSRLYEHAQALMDRRFLVAGFQRLLREGIYRPPAGDFEIDLAHPMPGSGWYQPENEGGAFWRWTGPTRRFTLELALVPGCGYDVTLDFTVGTPGQLAAIGVTAGDQPVAVSCVGLHPCHECRFTVAPSAIEAGGMCRLVFDASEVFRPSDAGGSDIRPLGLCVTRVRFARSPA